MLLFCIFDCLAVSPIQPAITTASRNVSTGRPFQLTFAPSAPAWCSHDWDLTIILIVQSLCCGTETSVITLASPRLMIPEHHCAGRDPKTFAFCPPLLARRPRIYTPALLHSFESYIVFPCRILFRLFAAHHLRRRHDLPLPERRAEHLKLASHFPSFA